MHSGFAITLLLLCLISSFLITDKPVSGTSTGVENSWTEMAPMPTARYYLHVATVDGKIYAIGGSTDQSTDGSEQFCANNEMYNPVTNKWTTKAPMPTARGNFAIAVYQNKIYCIGGNIALNPLTGTTTTDLNEIYNPATNSWSYGSPMPISRGSVYAATVNGKIYVMGGLRAENLNSVTYFNNTQVYNPKTDSWSETTAVPTPTCPNIVCAAGDEIFVFQVDARYPPQTLIFNTVTGNWTEGKPIPLIHGAYAAASINDSLGYARIFVVGGYPYSPIPTQVYDVAADKWSDAAKMISPNTGIDVAVAGGKMHTFGGGETQNTTEMYTPAVITTSTSQTPTPTVPEFAVLTIPFSIIAMATTGLLVYFKRHKPSY